MSPWPRLFPSLLNFVKRPSLSRVTRCQILFIRNCPSSGDGRECLDPSQVNSLLNRIGSARLVRLSLPTYAPPNVPSNPKSSYPILSYGTSVKDRDT